MDHVQIHPEVKEAIDSARPVVALESAVITSGLPRQPLRLPDALDIPGWNSGEPVNLELARALQRTVRAGGAVPATIAVIEGTLRIGLADHDIERLATDIQVGKSSSSGLAAIVALGGTAGTTVSATLCACAVSQSKTNPGGIRVFATGGIGGVHRNWQQRPDISADLRAIATTPVCVVCSGAKSILDVPATLELLETLGIPVVGYRTNRFPRFQCEGNDELRISRCVEDIQSAALVCTAHWSTLNRPTGIVLANPVPRRFAMNASELENAVDQAESLASSRSASGAARTPFLLAEIARLTENRSLYANVALLRENATVATALASELATTGKVTGR